MLSVTPRALGFGETLDVGFTLYRRHFVTLFLIALLPRIPEVLWWIGITALVPSAIQGFGAFVILPWSFFITFLTLGALSRASAQAWEGVEPDVREALGAGLSRWVTVAVAGVLTYIAFFFGLLFILLPGFFVLASLFAFAPVAMVEGGGPMQVLSRSWTLSRGGRLRILGVSFVAYLLILIPTAAVGAASALLVGGTGGFLADDPTAVEGSMVWLEGMLQVAGPVISAVVWPLFVTVTVVLYMDRRARVDAPELEAALGRLDAIG